MRQQLQLQEFLSNASLYFCVYRTAAFTSSKGKMNLLALVLLASMVAKSSQLTCDTDLRRPGMMCHLQPSPDLCSDVTSHSSGGS